MHYTLYLTLHLMVIPVYIFFKHNLFGVLRCVDSVDLLMRVRCMQTWRFYSRAGLKPASTIDNSYFRFRHYLLHFLIHRSANPATLRNVACSSASHPHRILRPSSLVFPVHRSLIPLLQLLNFNKSAPQILYSRVCLHLIFVQFYLSH